MRLHAVPVQIHAEQDRAGIHEVPIHALAEAPNHVWVSHTRHAWETLSPGAETVHVAR